MARPNLETDLTLRTAKADKAVAGVADKATQLFEQKGFKLNIKEANYPLGKITGDFTKFGDSLEAAASRVLAFTATTTAVYGLATAFSRLITDSIKLEKQLASIQSILQTSASNLQKFSQELFGVANATGQAFDVAAEAASEFARQGLSLEDTLKATSAALIFSKIAGIDATQAVENLTASLNTFNNEALGYVDIVDTIVSLDNSFAISAAGIADGLKRVGSVASESGIELKEVASLISVVQQVSARGAPVISNGLKTIFTRLGRSGVQDALGNIGVATTDANGQFRDQIDVLTDLANKLDSLSDTQRAFILEQVGGVYQINTLQSTLKSLRGEYSLYDKAVKIAGDSSGNASQRLKILTETTDAQFQKLKNNVTQFLAEAGKITVKPIVDDFIGIANSGFDNLLAGLGVGNKAEGKAEESGFSIGKALIGGIQSALQGPAIVLAIVTITKLINRLVQDVVTALKVLSGIKQASAIDSATQQTVNDAIRLGNKELVRRLAVTQDINEQTLILNTLLRDAAQRQRALQVSALVATGLTKAGAKQATPNNATGFVPHFSDPESIEKAGAKQHGYKAGRVYKTRVHDGTGKSQLSYVNSAENIINFVNSNGKRATMVVPPNGFSKDTTYASTGFVPSFADSENISGVRIKNLKETQPLRDSIGSRLKKWARLDTDSTTSNLRFRDPDTGESTSFADVISDFTFNKGLSDKEAREYLDWLGRAAALNPSIRDVVSDIRFSAERPIEQRSTEGFAKPIKSTEKGSGYKATNILENLPLRKKYFNEGFVPNFAKDKAKAFPFGDFRTGVIDSTVTGNTAKIHMISSFDEGRGNSSKLYQGFFKKARKNNLTTVEGDLVAQDRKPRENTPLSKVLAKYPQLSRGKYSARSSLQVGETLLEFGGGDDFYKDLEKNAEFILSNGPKFPNLPFKSYLFNGFVPNFVSLSSLIGRGVEGSFHKLTDEVGVKRFHKPYSLPRKTLEPAVENEFLLSKLLSESSFPGVSAPTIYDTLERAKKAKSIRKQIVKDPIAFDSVGRLPANAFGDILENQMYDQGLYMRDLHGGNYTLNEQGQNFIRANAGYFVNGQGFNSEEDFYQAFIKSGGKATIIDAGYAEIRSPDLKEKIQKYKTSSVGFVPNFVSKSSMIGEGSFGSFHKLTDKIGVKRFKKDAYNTDKDRKEAVANEFAMSKILAETPIVKGVRGVQIPDSLSRAIRTKSIRKEIAQDQLGQDALGARSGYHLGRIVEEALRNKGLNMTDLHGQNYTLNDAAIKFVKKNENYFKARTRSGDKDFFERLQAAGGVVTILDAADGTPESQELENKYFEALKPTRKNKSAGFIPSFASRADKLLNIRGRSNSYLRYGDSEEGLYIADVNSAQKGDAFKMFSKLTQLSARVKKPIVSELLFQEKRGAREAQLRYEEGRGLKEVLQAHYPQLRYREIPNLQTSGSIRISGSDEDFDFDSLESMEKILPKLGQENILEGNVDIGNLKSTYTGSYEEIRDFNKKNSRGTFFSKENGKRKSRYSRNLYSDGFIPNFISESLYQRFLEKRTKGYDFIGSGAESRAYKQGSDVIKFPVERRKVKSSLEKNKVLKSVDWDEVNKTVQQSEPNIVFPAIKKQGIGQKQEYSGQTLYDLFGFAKADQLTKLLNSKYAAAQQTSGGFTGPLGNIHLDTGSSKNFTVLGQPNFSPEDSIEQIYAKNKFAVIDPIIFEPYKPLKYSSGFVPNFIPPSGTDIIDFAGRTVKNPKAKTLFQTALGGNVEADDKLASRGFKVEKIPVDAIGSELYKNLKTNSKAAKLQFEKIAFNYLNTKGYNFRPGSESEGGGSSSVDGYSIDNISDKSISLLDAKGGGDWTPRAVANKFGRFIPENIEFLKVKAADLAKQGIIAPIDISKLFTEGVPDEFDIIKNRNVVAVPEVIGAKQGDKLGSKRDTTQKEKLFYSDEEISLYDIEDYRQKEEDREERKKLRLQGISPEQIAEKPLSARKKILLERQSQEIGTLDRLRAQLGIRSSGFVPNFADPLKEAKEREMAAGYSKNEVKVAKSLSLVTPLNPQGLGVYNSDEGSLMKGMSLAKQAGIDPRSKGLKLSHGFIPNFAGKNRQRNYSRKNEKLNISKRLKEEGYFEKEIKEISDAFDFPVEYQRSVVPPVPTIKKSKQVPIGGPAIPGKIKNTFQSKLKIELPENSSVEQKYEAYTKALDEEISKALKNKDKEMAALLEGKKNQVEKVFQKNKQRIKNREATQFLKDFRTKKALDKEDLLKINQENKDFFANQSDIQKVEKPGKQSLFDRLKRGSNKIEDIQRRERLQGQALNFAFGLPAIVGAFAGPEGQRSEAGKAAANVAESLGAGVSIASSLGFTPIGVAAGVLTAAFTGLSKVAEGTSLSLTDLESNVDTLTTQNEKQVQSASVAASKRFELDELRRSGASPDKIAKVESDFNKAVSKIRDEDIRTAVSTETDQDKLQELLSDFQTQKSNEVEFSKALLSLGTLSRAIDDKGIGKNPFGPNFFEKQKEDFKPENFEAVFDPILNSIDGTALASDKGKEAIDQLRLGFIDLAGFFTNFGEELGLSKKNAQAAAEQFKNLNGRFNPESLKSFTDFIVAALQANNALTEQKPDLPELDSLTFDAARISKSIRESILTQNSDKRFKRTTTKSSKLNIEEQQLNFDRATDKISERDEIIKRGELEIRKRNLEAEDKIGSVSDNAVEKLLSLTKDKNLTPEQDTKLADAVVEFQNGAIDFTDLRNTLVDTLGSGADQKTLGEIESLTRDTVSELNKILLTNQTSQEEITSLSKLQLKQLEAIAVNTVGKNVLSGEAQKARLQLKSEDPLAIPKINKEINDLKKKAERSTSVSEKEKINEKISTKEAERERIIERRRNLELTARGSSDLAPNNDLLKQASETQAYIDEASKLIDALNKRRAELGNGQLFTKENKDQFISNIRTGKAQEAFEFAISKTAPVESKDPFLQELIEQLRQLGGKKTGFFKDQLKEDEPEIKVDPIASTDVQKFFRSAAEFSARTPEAQKKAIEKYTQFKQDPTIQKYEQVRNELKLTKERQARLAEEEKEIPKAVLPDFSSVPEINDVTGQGYADVVREGSLEIKKGVAFLRTLKTKFSEGELSQTVFNEQLAREDIKPDIKEKAQKIFAKTELPTLTKKERDAEKLRLQQEVDRLMQEGKALEKQAKPIIDSQRGAIATPTLLDTNFLSSNQDTAFLRDKLKESGDPNLKKLSDKLTKFLEVKAESETNKPELKTELTKMRNEVQQMLAQNAGPLSNLEEKVRGLYSPEAMGPQTERKGETKKEEEPQMQTVEALGRLNANLEKQLEIAEKPKEVNSNIKQDISVEVSVEGSSMTEEQRKEITRIINNEIQKALRSTKVENGKVTITTPPSA